MKEIAILIRQVIIDKRDPASVDSQVRALTEGFRSIRYSIDEGKSPYAPLVLGREGKRVAPVKVRKRAN